MVWRNVFKNTVFSFLLKLIIENSPKKLTTVCLSITNYILFYKRNKAPCHSKIEMLQFRQNRNVTLDCLQRRRIDEDRPTNKI